MCIHTSCTHGDKRHHKVQIVDECHQQQHHSNGGKRQCGCKVALRRWKAVLDFCRLIVVKFTYRNSKISLWIIVAFDSRLLLDKEFCQCAVKFGKCTSIGKFYIHLVVPVVPVIQVVIVEKAYGIERRKVAIFREVAVDGSNSSLPVCLAEDRYILVVCVAYTRTEFQIVAAGKTLADSHIAVCGERGCVALYKLESKHFQCSSRIENVADIEQEAFGIILGATAAAVAENIYRAHLFDHRHTVAYKFHRTTRHIGVDGSLAHEIAVAHD